MKKEDDIYPMKDHLTTLLVIGIIAVAVIIAILMYVNPIFL